MITPLKDYFSKDDNSLVRQARKGDIGAFEELVARHRDKLFTRAFNVPDVAPGLHAAFPR
jgi:hypothetical protein